MLSLAACRPAVFEVCTYFLVPGLSGCLCFFFPAQHYQLPADSFSCCGCLALPAAGAEGAADQEQQQQQQSGEHWPSREVTYADFVSDAMWLKMTKGLKKEEKACMKAPLVYQELMSYIKGSAEALEAGGHLSLEQYLEVRRKVCGGLTASFLPSAG